MNTSRHSSWMARGAGPEVVKTAQVPAGTARSGRVRGGRVRTVPRRRPPPASGLAGDGWDFYLRHPWVLQVSQARPVLGPNEYAVLEALLRILRAAGLEATLVRRVVGTLYHFVRATAQTAAEALRAGAETGVDDTEWWYARSAVMGQVVPDFAERYPTVHWLNSAAAEAAAKDEASHADDADVPYLVREAKRTFDAGLAVLLDGVAGRVPPRAASRPEDS
ncbi:TetR/AcrR family transcriptional regulator C-terminal domain-containing protein [Streptomyces griseus]|uniref:TetR/AcrR family transcriptional regulator C-terminal domain-containing protein n=1 Tax=Streptomyces griseus TaxID=1911 RepID=UPI00068FF95C|nr:TetR/AcrR family transcriptional regulator C-terminal domain-containing protein [Streptomyces griseus]